MLADHAQAGAPPAESDIPYAGAQTLRVGTVTLRVEGTRLLGPGATLTERLYTDPVADSTHVCAADDGTNGTGRLRCWNADLKPTTLFEGGRPDRLAMHGDHVAWVASPGGLPQVYIGWADAHAAPRALTNVDLKRVPGRAPEGFVPPPLGRTLRFEGDWLRWETPDGTRRVGWQ